MRKASGRTGEEALIINGSACVTGTDRGGLHVLSFRDGQSGFDTKEVTSGGIGPSPPQMHCMA